MKTFVNIIILILFSNFIIYNLGFYSFSYDLVPNTYIKNLINNNNNIFKSVIIDEKNNLAYFYKNTTVYEPSYIVKISSRYNYENTLKDFYYNNTNFNNLNIIYETTKSLFSYFIDYISLFFIVYMVLSLFKCLFFRNNKNSNTKGFNLSSIVFPESEFKITTNVNTKFDNVIGLKSIKEDLKQYVDMINNRQKYINSGAKLPKGLLFTGPPGTGKTLLAQALAGETGTSFISVSGSDFIEVYVGVGAKRVRNLFKLARENSPCIIFIDEIDALGRKRNNGDSGGHSEQGQTINKLLCEMDGFTANDNIMVIAATNMKNVLDKALTRSGRFDRNIVFDNPNINERKELFKLYLNKISLDKLIKNDFDNNCNKLAKMTSGLSGADIANISNQAIILYLKRNNIKKLNNNNDDLNNDLNNDNDENNNDENNNDENDDDLNNDLNNDDENDDNDDDDYDDYYDENNDDLNNNDENNDDLNNNDENDDDLNNNDGNNDENNDDLNNNDENDNLEKGATFNDIEQAIDEVMVGIKKTERLMTEEERNIVAHHEAGHALMSYLLKHTNPPVKVSIVPRGDAALGFSQQESTDKKLYSKEELYDKICVYLGGRIAEEIIFGKITTGAADDIEKLTEMTYHMVCVYGMSDNIGTINHKLDNSYIKISDSRKYNIDKEVQNIINIQYKRTKELLITHQNKIIILANHLLQTELLLSDDIKKLIDDNGKLKNSV